MTTVLLVDDNEDEYKKIYRAFRHVPEPVRCIYANSTERALEMARFVVPKVIFVDIGVRGIDGIGCIKGIREITADRKPIVVAYSDLIDEETCQRAKKAGADHCLQKTVSVAVLVDRLLPFLT